MAAAYASSLQWPAYVFSDVPTGADQALNRGQAMHRLHKATIVSAAHDSSLESDERLAMLFEGSFWGNDRGRGDASGVGHLTSPILFHSGASSNFVSPRLLQQLAISCSSSLQHCAWQMTLQPLSWVKSGFDSSCSRSLVLFLAMSQTCVMSLT